MIKSYCPLVNLGKVAFANLFFSSVIFSLIKFVKFFLFKDSIKYILSFSKDLKGIFISSPSNIVIDLL